MLSLSKSVFILFLALCAVFFCACLPQTETRSYTAENTEDLHTLKTETELRRRTLVWTAPMKKVDEPVDDGDKNNEKEGRTESAVQDAEKGTVMFGIAPSEKEESSSSNNSEGPLFSEKLLMLTGVKEKNIYPVMPGLGGMDVSQMSTSIYSKLTEFLNGVKNKTVKSTSPVFAEKYTGVIFLYELGFYPDISSWYIGTPFISRGNSSGTEDVYEIPVLCLTKSGKFMCWISIDASSAFQSEFLVKQIVLGELS